MGQNGDGVHLLAGEGATDGGDVGVGFDGAVVVAAAVAEAVSGGVEGEKGDEEGAGGGEGSRGGRCRSARGSWGCRVASDGRRGVGRVGGFRGAGRRDRGLRGL